MGGIFELLNSANSADDSPVEAPRTSSAGRQPRESREDASADAAGQGAGITPIALDTLRLDLAQPRRPLPLKYASRVNAGALTLVDAVKAWAKDAGVSLKLDDAADERTTRGPGAALDALKRELAQPILEVGLINPISVVAASDGHYTIETGERRALAHALLVAAGHAAFANVPTQIVGRDVDIARRQIEENEAREDLSAVHRARMWWNARYRLSKLGRIDWSKYDGAANLNDALSASERGELVTWTEVERALGRTRQMRAYHLRVLDMPAEAIRLAEEYGLSEKALRPVLEAHAGNPDKQLALVRDEVARLAGGAQATSSRAMQARVKAGKAKPAKTGEADVGGYKRAISAFDRLTGGKALAAREVKRLSESLGEDESLVDAARRLKPLIDRLAGG
jgi:hypothetical protein